MSDPKFFRKYLDILDEQNVASANIGNAKFSADQSTNTVSGTYDVDDATQITATQDTSKGGATSVGAKTNIGGVDIAAKHNSPAYNKGQLAGTSSISASYKGDTLTATKGVGFQGAGANVKPGQNIIYNYSKTN